MMRTSVVLVASALALFAPEGTFARSRAAAQSSTHVLSARVVDGVETVVGDRAVREFRYSSLDASGDVVPIVKDVQEGALARLTAEVPEDRPEIRLTVDASVTKVVGVKRRRFAAEGGRRLRFDIPTVATVRAQGTVDVLPGARVAIASGSAPRGRGLVDEIQVFASASPVAAGSSDVVLEIEHRVVRGSAFRSRVSAPSGGIGWWLGDVSRDEIPGGRFDGAVWSGTSYEVLLSPEVSQDGTSVRFSTIDVHTRARQRTFRFVADTPSGRRRVRAYEPVESDLSFQDVAVADGETLVLGEVLAPRGRSAAAYEMRVTPTVVPQTDGDRPLVDVLVEFLPAD